MNYYPYRKKYPLNIQKSLYFLDFFFKKSIYIIILSLYPVKAENCGYFSIKIFYIDFILKIEIGRATISYCKSLNFYRAVFCTSRQREKLARVDCFAILHLVPMCGHSLLVLSPSTANKKYTAIQASLMLCILVVLLFSLSHYFFLSSICNGTSTNSK